MEIWQHADFATSLLDAVDALVVVIDHDGVIRLFNGACERTSGFTEAEVLGQPFTSFLTDTEHDAVWAAFQAFVRTGSPSRHENQWRTKSGGPRVISWSAAALAQPDGSVAVLATGIDLTERRHAEAEAARTRAELERSVAARTASLHECENRFGKLANDLPTGVCVARWEDGQVLYANPAFHRIFGTSPPAPRTPELYWDPAERSRLLAEIRAQGGVRHRAIWMRRADGARVAVELSATEIELDGEPAVLAVGYEATERLASAEALRRRAVLIDAICDSVITFDLSGHVTSWNAGAERLYGWCAAEALGRTVDFLWRDEKCARASLEEVISRGRLDLVRPSLTKSGEVVDVALTLTLARTPDGAPSCIVGQSWDFAGRQTVKDALSLSIDERLCEAQAFAARVVAEAEAERRRIARELHDGALQSMSAASLHLTCALQLEEGPDSLMSSVLAARTATLAAAEELRRACSDLRPDLLDNLGLLGALATLAAEHQERTGARVELDGCLLPQLGPDCEIAVFRLVQEALRNIALHARAQHVVVRLRDSDGSFSVDIEDDGCGFEAAASRGQGLRGMRERIDAVGGHVEVRSLPRQGTRVTARIAHPRT